MRRIAVAVYAVAVLALGMTAAIATPPKDVTRTDIARAVMTSDSDVHIEQGKDSPAAARKISRAARPALDH